MRNGVKYLHALAKFTGPNKAMLTTEAEDMSEVSFSHALISVGTKPHRPANIPFDHENVFDSDEILDIKTLPRTLTVMGGGVIGVEYATIFSALDVPVTLIEKRENILEFVDRELVDDFIHQMRDRGMTVRLGCDFKDVVVKPTGAWCAPRCCCSRRGAAATLRASG
jgi:NAD(P) transhydrogenase